MDNFRIAFISGKFGDVDGVSLEVDKWISVLLEMGHDLYTIAGKYGGSVENVPEEHQFTIEDLRFDSTRQHNFERAAFPHLSSRPPHLSEEKEKRLSDAILRDGSEIADEIYEIIKEHNIDVIIAENTNAMPMTLLGAVAIYKLSTERRVATIFHHHDFWWERSRFSNNHIEPLLNRIMPPSDLGTEHVVISSYAAHILRSIKRVNPLVVPNCEDFGKMVKQDDYNNHFRKDLGFAEDDIIILQPTRIVPRKRIEDSVRLCGKLIRKYPEYADRLHFVISLYQGDETDTSYVDHIKDLADARKVPLHLISDRVAATRRTDEEGRRIYTNRDVLTQADIVTYLPIWEGFGNALLEAVAAQVPIITTTYLVYKTDIGGIGLENIEIRDQYNENGELIIEDCVLDAIDDLLKHPEKRPAMVQNNLEKANKEFGFGRLKKDLERLMEGYGDEIKASRKRLEKSKKNYAV